MDASTKITGLTRLFWSFVLGVGLVLGLLWLLALHSTVKAQAVNPGLVTSSARAAIPDQAVSDSAAPTVRASVDVPPAPPHDRRTTPRRSRAAGEALPFAPIGDAGAAPRTSAAVQPAPTLPYDESTSLHDQARAFSGVPLFAPAVSARSRGGTPLTPPLPGSADLAVCMTTDRVWGVVGAGEMVTVTVGGAQMGAALADGNGFFWTTLYDASGDRPHLSGGETVVIYSDGVPEASVTLRSISGQVDVVSDVVSGAISGGSFPISVTVYAPWGEPAMTSYSQTASTDGSGNFSADLSGVWNFVAWNDASVAYVEGGVEVHRHVYPSNGLVVRPWPFNTVMGTAAPGALVTATLYLSDMTQVESASFTANSTDGQYYWSVPTDVLETDVIVVELAGGTVMSRAVDTLSLNVDATADRVTGQALPGATVRGIVDDLTPLGWRGVQTSATADASGVYTLEFSALGDILPGYWATVFVADAEGDDLNQYNHTPLVQVQQTWNGVSGRGPSPPGTESEGRVVSVTLYSAVSDTTFVYSQGMDWYSWYSFGEGEGLPDIAAGDVLTVEAEGYAWQGVVQVQTMTVQHDVDAERFTGTVETPGDRVELSGSQWAGWSDVAPHYPLGGFFDTLTTASSPFTATLAGFDVRNAVGYNVGHRTSSDYVESIYREVDWVRVWPGFNGLLSWFGPPGTAYTVTLRDSGGGIKAQLSGTSSGTVGEPRWDEFGWSGQQIEPGDRLQAQSAAGFSQTVHVPLITALMDESNDLVSGNAPPNTLLNVYVDGQGRGFVPTDGSGEFSVAVDQLQEFWGDGDLVWGNWVRVCYINQDANQVCQNFNWPQIYARYDMDGRNTVFGHDALPGSTIVITVTDELSQVVDSGVAYAGSGWDGPTSYALDFPDGVLVPSNTVTVDFGGGYVDYVHVVTIAGYPDPDSDIVTGTAPAEGWLSAWVEHQWGDQTSINNVQVDAGGVYTLDLRAEGWDVQHGDSFHVYYHAPHGHQVEYWFWLPAPELYVNKWTTPGNARPGGVYLYGVNYGNNGNGTAANTVITDTLPPSTTYAADSSGFPVSDGGGVVSWTLDDTPPGTHDTFYVALAVDSAAPTQTNLSPNCAGSATSSPGDYDPGNDESCSGEAWVDEGDAGLGVNKWPGPSDPHPGQEFAYYIDYGSDGSAATGPAWLTDTLPVSTTFVSWEEEWGWSALWTEVVTTGGQFVLYAPAGVPGDMGGRIRLTLLLDPGAPIDTVLENTVVITTAGDVYPGNNQYTNTDARVSPARYDMRVDKWFNNGVLVPGGWMDYGISYNNQGNVATHAWVTDTLPAGAAYDSAWAWGGDGQPLAPVAVTDDYVVWDLGVVGVNKGSGIDVRLNISPTLTPGAVLTNCVTISISETEDTPWDNASCVASMVYTAGLPNLHVSKESHDYWPGNGNINYSIGFGNYGDQTVYDVHITDTFPVSTTHDWHNVNWWGEGQYTDTTSASELALVFERMEPGWSGRVDLSVNLDDPNARLRWYTNTAGIDTPPDDANASDNSDSDTVFSGGEVNRVDLWADDSYIEINVPQTPVTITTAYTQVVLWWNDFGWNLPNPIQPGDTLTVAAGNGTLPVVMTMPAPFTAHSSSITDTVWGQVDHLDHEWIEVGLDDGPSQSAQTDGSGNYSAIFPDVPRGGRGEVRYDTEIAYADVTFHRRFESPDLILNVNYGYDWVNGNYEPDHTLWLTVTESDGYTVKATAVLTTGPIPWWGGQSGFETQGEDWWPNYPDIEPGDWVYGLLDNGYASSVRVGTINGELDVDADTVSGTVHANWFTQTLNADCGVWEENGPGQGFTVAPDGGSYFCDFGAMGWDLQPHQSVGVQYQELDGDWVINMFWGPAADLAVDNNGQGQPAPGGNYVYTVNYHNYGDAAASSVVISDALPTGLSYLADTSGFSHTLDGNTLVWDLGGLGANVDSFFDVFVEVDAGLTPTTRVTNVVQIATPDYETDLGNNYHDWWTEVVTNDTHLNVGKGAWTGDPAPDTDFVYSVNVCNNGSTSSSQVVITDTLHPLTTLQSWWAQHDGWTDIISSSNELVLSRPSLPDGWCSEVYLRVHLDAAAWSGMSISNTALISASNDLEDDDNESTWWGQVNDPHTNLSVNKNWNGGQLVPGGQLYYWIDYDNTGNVPVGSNIRITDTLPVSTTFVESWLHRRFQPTIQITPTFGSGYVVWEVGSLDNGYSGNVEVALAVDSNAISGTVLVNSVEISPQPDEDSYEDNQSQVTETLYAPGPNLRVTKWHNWNSDGQLGYTVRFENIGDETISAVWITDSLPLSTTWDGWWDMGFDWGRLVSQTQSSDLLRWQFSELYPGDSGWLYFNTDLDTPGARLRWYTNTVGIATPLGDVNPNDNQDVDVAFSGGEVNSVHLWADDSYIEVNAPQTPVTITTAYTQVVLWWDDFGWNLPNPVQPGDTLTVAAGSGTLPVVMTMPDPFTAHASSITDTVWGQVDHLDHEWIEVDLDGGPSQSAQTDGSGNYSAIFPDVPRGGRGEVRYDTEISYADVTFHRRFETPDLIMTVDYGYDWVNGSYEPDHTLWLTVTESDGSTVKATAVLATGPIPWWGGQSGFETQGEDWWPNSPDIEPGDWVYGLLDNGYASTVRVGAIDGGVDVDNDVISGTVDAPWFSPASLTVNCEIHEENGESIQVHNVDPDGGSFLCDFDGLFDIQPGHNVALNYDEPDRDRVQARPPNPAPNLRVEKWVEGNSETFPGGTVVYGIYYSNDGDATATGVVLTDTLPPSTTYASDSSGFIAYDGGDVVAWNLGDLTPGSQTQFHLALDVDGGAVVGENIANNVITITAANEPLHRLGDNRAESGEIYVGSGAPDLAVEKYPNPGDPAPGETMLWEINYNNGGPVASGPVWLTDTLPLSTTLVSWYSENGYTLWTEEITSGGQFVLSAAALPGNWGDRIYLRLRLSDVLTYGTQLTNTVEITTGGDSDPGNNWHTRDDVWVNPPRWDAYINKGLQWGRLVPGGEVEYWLHMYNFGNTATQVWVTDTLPVGTVLVETWGWDGMNSTPFPPDHVEDGVAVWDLGVMEPGSWYNLGPRLAISPTVAPDTVITNCASVGITQTDSYPDNNTVCVVDAVREPGPNLRVYKESSWEWEGQIRYDIRFENIGTTQMEDIWITDTYPISTTFNGDWWGGVDYDPWVTLTHDAPNRRLIFRVQELASAHVGDIGFRVDLDGAIHGVQGLLFTNTVAAPWPGDVYPADNSDVDLSYTGPDVYVAKQLSGGRPRPGEIVTFTVEFGNRNDWWSGDEGYGSHITDTLPPEMTFVNAIAPWDPDWMPNQLPGNVLVWDWGTMWSGSTWYFDVVAQITDTLVGWEVITNVIEAYGDSPNDVEVFWDNNVFALPVTVFPTNTVPVLSGLPDQIFDQDASLPGTIDLWAYASDAETPVDALTYTLEITPPAGAGVTLDGNRYVTINPSTSWCGYTDVTVRATDPGGLWGTDTFRVAVTWSCQG